MPEPMVLVPIPLVPVPLEPIGALLPDIEPDDDESVDGIVAAGGTTVVLVSSFLLQAPKVNKAASATDAVAKVLIFELNMRISLGR